MSQEEPRRGDKAQSPRPVPVVALGASAGGIEALGQFFDAMPPDSGMAFVAVLHLHPTHESQLAHILSQRTSMPVLEIEDGMAIERDRVYAIVPNASLEVRDGHLRLSEPQAPRASAVRWTSSSRRLRQSARSARSPSSSRAPATTAPTG